MTATASARCSPWTSTWPPRRRAPRPCPAQAHIYAWQDGALQELHTASADNSITSYTAIHFGKLGRDLSAVVVDGAKADGSMTTQVFTLEDGLLLNSPAGVNSESYQNPFSRPSAAVFTSQDVNGDGLLEIPVASQLPAIPEDVSLDSTGFLVEWVNADTSGNYETALTALMNLGENYWFRLPASLVGKISALQQHRRPLGDVHRGGHRGGRLPAAGLAAVHHPGVHPLRLGQPGGDQRL